MANFRLPLAPVPLTVGLDGWGGNVLCLASRDRRSVGNIRRALGEMVVITWEKRGTLIAV